MKTKIFTFVVLFMVAGLFAISSAQVPQMINYQGKLTKAGTCALDTTIYMTFKIYADSTTPTFLWSETQYSIKIEDGIFNVLLGDTTSIPDSVFNGSIRYLGVTVGSELNEMKSRKPIVSSGYAYKAEHADTAKYSLGGAGIGGSGTANYIPKFTGSTTLGNSMIYQSGSKVGINTTNPQTMLANTDDDGTGTTPNTDAFVWKSFGTDCAAIINNEGTGNGMRIETNSGSTVRIFETTNGSDYGLIVDGNCRAAVGGTEFGSRFNVVGGVSIGPNFANYAAPSNGMIIEGSVGVGTYPPLSKLDVWGPGSSSATSGLSVKNSAGSSNLLVRDDGRVGIGTTSPGSALSVWGNAAIGTGYCGSAAPSNGMIIEGNVGIGTASPAYRLDVAGALNLNKGVSSGGALYVNGWEALWYNGTYFSWGEGGLANYFEDEVGIGTSTPTQMLDVNGTARLRNMGTTSGTNVVVDGNGVLYRSSSSKRYKENIRPLEVIPEEALKLQPVRFKWKTTGAEDIGLIAEDVNEVIPDLVIYDNEGKPDAVKYDRISLYLLEMVKAQQQQIEALKGEIERMKSGGR